MLSRLLLVLGVLALSAACKPSAPPLTAAPSPNAPSGQVVAPVSDLAPELTIETLEGRTFRLSEQRGRPVVLFFTASWCASCIPEIGTLNRLYELYRDQGLQIVVVSIDPGDTPADLQRFKALAKGADYVWGLDRGGRALLDYQVTALETKVVVGRDGRIVARHVGRELFEAAKATVESAL